MEKNIRTRNVDIGMTTKESPAMDITRMYIGYSPRTVFKGNYRKSIAMSDKQLVNHIKDTYLRKTPEYMAPYLYDAGRRKIKLPNKITGIYNIPTSSYVREITQISGKPSEKYVGANMTASGALTGIAALDYLSEPIEASKYVHSYAARVGAKSVEGIKRKYLGSKGSELYSKAMESSLGELVAGKNVRKNALIGRLIGTMGTMPLAGIAALPLMSSRVVKNLRGDNEGSAKYKVFDWLYRHPGAPVAASFMPLGLKKTVEAAIEAKHIMKNVKGQQKTRLLKALAGRTAIGRGKMILGAIGATSLIKMRRNMMDSRDEERDLIEKKLIKKHQTT